MKAKYIKTCLFAIRSHIRMIRNTFAFVILIACTCLPHFQCDVIFDHAPAPPAPALRCTEHNNDKKRVQMETQERKGIPTKTVSRARYNRRSKLKAMKLVRFSLSYGACCLEESSAPAGLLTELILPVNCECDVIFDHAPAPPAPPTSMLADKWGARGVRDCWDT